MGSRTLQRSFAGGLMSPSMLARVDDTRFQSGYAEDTKNMLVQSNGSIQRRPGMRYVAACKFANKKCRLLRMSHSIDTQIIIELGDLYFRFHQDGAPVYYAKPLVVAAIDTTALVERITFTERHDLTNETLVQFTADSGLNAHLPGGVTAGTSYYVTVIDKKTITVSTTTPAGTPLNLTSSGTGTIRVFRNSEMPADWATNTETITSPGGVDVNGESLTVDAGPHSYLTGQPLRFTTSGSLPLPLQVGITYFVRSPGANTFLLTTTLELASVGPSINITTVGSGTHTAHRTYLHGELVFYTDGTNHGVFYAKNDVSTQNAPLPSNVNWLQMRADGILELVHPYLEADLFDITYDADNNAITLAHRSYPVADLVRYSIHRWTYTPITLQPSLPAPETVPPERVFGDYIRFRSNNPGGGVIALWTISAPVASGGHGFVQSDTVFVEKSNSRTFLEAAVSVGSDTIDLATAHGMAAGDPISFTSQIISPVHPQRPPAPLVAGRIYYAIVVSATVIKVATSRDNALLGINIDLTDDGVPVGITHTAHWGVGSGAAFGENPAGNYVISHTGNPSPGGFHTDLHLRSPEGGHGITIDAVTDVVMRYVSLSSQADNSYRITAVDVDNVESTASAVITVNDNDLSVSGSLNRLLWRSVSSASFYNVYKLLNGLYSFLAKVESGTVEPTGQFLFYEDDNSLQPDSSRTLPTFDTTLSGTGRNPAATTHYEQRRFFGGTTEEPQTVWATRPGTDADLSFRQPLLPDDRINVELQAREAVSIRHLVPIEQLLILTNSTEFRMIPVNSDVLTPTTIDAKAHDYTGASKVQPSVLSGNVVFCGSRGGHIYEVGWRRDGFGLSEPGDLCLRSDSLFNNKTISDQIAVKAPQPIIFFVSSDGRLLGITYVPQEQIGAWHAHDTPGTFESISFASEGAEDHLYAVVLRDIDGTPTRFVERMALQRFSSLRESYFGDAGGTYDGRNTDTTKTVTITGGLTWQVGESVTVTANATLFVGGSEDVGDEIALWDPADPETLYRIRITVVSSGTVATGTLRQSLPVRMQGIATSAWGFARDAISLPWLEGEEVEILSDGLELDAVEVTGDLATLPSPGLVVQVGLLAEAELHSLPLGFQVDALAQGRPKNVNRTWIKVLDSGGFRLGPTTDNLVPSTPQPEPGGVLTEEIDTTVMPTYSQGGELVLRAGKMQPLSVLGWVMDVEIAGS